MMTTRLLSRTAVLVLISGGIAAAQGLTTDEPPVPESAGTIAPPITQGGHKGPETTGQGASAGFAKLSTEQRIKINTIIRQQQMAPAQLSVSVAVGSKVPPGVRLYPLPVEVINIYPKWHGYEYVMVGDEILVVEPDTHAIVAIIGA